MHARIRRQSGEAEIGAADTESTHRPVATEEEDAILLSHDIAAQDKHQFYGLDKQVLQAAAVVSSPLNFCFETVIGQPCSVSCSPALQVAPLWFAAQYTFNVSLLETTVTSNTILASTSSLFTYALSCLLFMEVFVISKLAFIFLCMAGPQAALPCNVLRATAVMHSKSSVIFYILSIRRSLNMQQW